jgi:hypothetical protein
MWLHVLGDRQVDASLVAYDYAELESSAETTNDQGIWCYTVGG